jgi:ATP-dependent Lhr-like helicase
VESVRASRNQASEHEITVAGADPMNLAGIVVPGERVAAVPGRAAKFRNGVLVQDAAKQPQAEAEMTLTQPAPEPSTLGLFQ